MPIGARPNSSRLAQVIVDRLRGADPAAVIMLRDVAVNPYPVLDEAALDALFAPAERCVPERAAGVAFDGAL